MYSQRVKRIRPSGSDCGLKSERVFILTQRTSVPSAFIVKRFDAGPGWQTVRPKRRVETKTIRPSAASVGETSKNGPSVSWVSPVPSTPIFQIFQKSEPSGR